MRTLRRIMLRLEGKPDLAIGILSDPRHASQIEAAAASRSEEIRDIGALIAADETLALALGDKLARREMPLNRYEAIMRPVDERLASLRAARAALDEPGELPRAGVNWAARWDAAEPEERRSLLRMALRGRALVIGKADPAAPADVPGRISIGNPV